MQHISKIGPVAALTLIQLHLENKGNRLELAELEELEAIVINMLTRLEDRLKLDYGEDGDTEPNLIITP